MHKQAIFLGSLIIGSVIVFACSSDPEDGPTTSCVAASTRACTGANNCAGTQTCSADGKGYGACTCSGPDSSIDDVFVPDTGADTGADAGPWTPRKIAGLSLWLDGSLGVVNDPVQPGKVQKWQDRSGLGNDVTSASSDGGTTEPVYDTSVINGKSAVRCDNDTFLTIASKDAFKFAAGDYGIITVAKASISGTTGPSFFEKGVSVGVTGQKSFVLITKNGIGSGSATLDNAPLDTFQIYVARGSQLEVQAGGKKATGPKTTIDVNDDAPVYICRGAGAAFTSIAELIVVKGALTDADIAEASTYLKSKYAL